mmetsp:Transcript_84283/g.243625  ORF Transcript_84283/g.243625 Transcript_84283/m.243625 type:complete len:219 (-) Transcript_84283:726-1382(-)
MSAMSRVNMPARSSIFSSSAAHSFMTWPTRSLRCSLIFVLTCAMPLLHSACCCSSFVLCESILAERSDKLERTSVNDCRNADDSLLSCIETISTWPFNSLIAKVNLSSMFVPLEIASLGDCRGRPASNSAMAAARRSLSMCNSALSSDSKVVCLWAASTCSMRTSATSLRQTDTSSSEWFTQPARRSDSARTRRSSSSNGLAISSTALASRERRSRSC